MSPPLCIDGELTIYRASELRESLLAALATLDPGADLELDLGGVTDMDSAGVQLLMAAQRSAAAADSRLSLAATSPAVADVLATLGLTAHFDVSSSRTPA
ncbi:STAS domain-containing protein [Rubrivivax gelatinosus]|uniref:STAS domain-containing protein n=1 Tax=Rubrivivax gelatinosus TaxID=28068 RepID=UPI0032119F67